MSTSVGFTKIKAFAWKCGQKISTSVGFTKIKAFAWKCGQNCANLLCRNNISITVNKKKNATRLIIIVYTTNPKSY